MRALCPENLLPYRLFVQHLPLFFVNLEEEVLGLSLKERFEYALNIDIWFEAVVAPK